MDGAWLADPTRSIDFDVFGAANHNLAVIGTAESGFQIWCSRCDLVGKRIYDSLDSAQQYVAELKKDIAPMCRSARRSA